MLFRTSRLLLLCLPAILFLAAPGSPQVPTLHISSDDMLHHYRLDGTRLNTTPIPYAPAPRPEGETARDLAVLADGTIAVYNGTAAPRLSRFDPASGSWTHQRLAGWSTSGNAGGMSSNPNHPHYVYASDMATPSGEALGLLRLDLRDGSLVRFGQTEAVDVIDVVVDDDLRVYALDPSGRAEIYDGETLQLDARVTFREPNIVAIATDSAGRDYAASRNGIVYVYQEHQRGQFDTGLTIVDIDVHVHGYVAVGTASGMVLVLDPDLRGVTHTLRVGDQPAYVAFGPAAARLPRSAESR